jgi:hypothetical protein
LLSARDDISELYRSSILEKRDRYGDERIAGKAYVVSICSVNSVLCSGRSSANISTVQFVGTDAQGNDGINRRPNGYIPLCIMIVVLSDTIFRVD